MPQNLPLALVTNDDGISSPFLHALIEALQPAFRVAIAAPAREQSWVGRAMSRRSDVHVEATKLLEAQAWAITGTPTDCVNIALGHLLAEKPSIVISGINIGYNTSMPLLMSSGTLAGALEGAHWGLPALALSQSLTSEMFESLQHDRSSVPALFQPTIAASAAHAAKAASKVITEGQTGLIVHNLNYPSTMSPGTPLEETSPSRVFLGSLFAPTKDGRYLFRFQSGQPQPARQLTDREALTNGAISWSRLNFSNLGESIEVVDSNA
jgi:5'-nucleotidase